MPLPPHPAHRHGRLLRVGRAARRPDPARQAGRGRRQPRRARRRRGGQLRGARVRRALGDADGARRPALSAPVDRAGPTSRSTRRRRRRCSRSSARSRRWSSRCRSTRPTSTSPRTPGASRSAARSRCGSRRPIHETHRADRLGRRRAEQVPREDRLGAGEAGRPDRDRAGARRALPAAAAGRRAVGRRPGHRAAPARARHRTSRRRSRGRRSRCSVPRSAATSTGCGGSPTASTIGRSSPTAPPKSCGTENTFAQDLTDLDEIRSEVDEMARDDAGWLERKGLLVPHRDDQGPLRGLHDGHPQPFGSSRLRATRTRSPRAPSRCSTGPRPACGRSACSASAFTTCRAKAAPTPAATPLCFFQQDPVYTAPRPSRRPCPCSSR